MIAGAQRLMSMSGSQITPDMIQRAKDILDTPSWEDIKAIFRSPERRNYKISVSTDALNEANDVEYKEQILEFGKTFIEMMQSIVPGVQQNPSLAPFSRELVMAVVKAFKVGRPLEEALEDGLNQIQNNPPQHQPNPETIKAQAEIQKAQTEGQVAMARAQAELQKIALQQQNDSAQRQLDAAQHQSDTQLKASDLAMQHERAMLDLQMKREQVELGKLNTLLQLKKLGISSRAQALAEWEASGSAQDMHERRGADIASQQHQDLLQAHDQVNRHDIERQKIAAKPADRSPGSERDSIV